MTRVEVALELSPPWNSTSGRPLPGRFRRQASRPRRRRSRGCHLRRVIFGGPKAPIRASGGGERGCCQGGGRGSGATRSLAASARTGRRALLAKRKTGRSVAAIDSRAPAATTGDIAAGQPVRASTTPRDDNGERPVGPHDEPFPGPERPGGRLEFRAGRAARGEERRQVRARPAGEQLPQRPVREFLFAALVTHPAVVGHDSPFARIA